MITTVEPPPFLSIRFVGGRSRRHSSESSLPPLRRRRRRRIRLKRHVLTGKAEFEANITSLDLSPWGKEGKRDILKSTSKLPKYSQKVLFNTPGPDVIKTFYVRNLLIFVIS